jgi:predicted nucleic acid-binding protein
VTADKKATRLEQAVWDACVVIDAISKTPGRYEALEPYIADAEAGKFKIVIPESVVAEVNHLTNESIPDDKAVRMIRDWFENPYIVRRGLFPGTSELASDIGRRYKVKRATDAIVLATAVFENIPVVHTFDGSGKKPGMIALDKMIGEPPLRIIEPNYWDGTLLEELFKAGK